MDKIILVVDDDVTSLKLASGILGKQYRIASAINGAAAFKYLEKNIPHLILLDLNMPDMDGFEVIERLKASPQHRNIPVIFLSAQQTPQNEAQRISAGAVDYVSKPYVPQVLLSRVQRTLELYDSRERLEAVVAEQANDLKQQTKHIDEIQNAMILGMANLIEERDSGTGYHVKNTQAYVKMLSKALRQRHMFPDILTDEYVDLLVKAAPLHDVGKIKITDLILQKPGKLSEDEYRIMQNHTRYGADIMEDILGGVEDSPQYLEIARDVALYHHERWDGNGYPEGLKGNDIPLCARIMAVADVFDALTADRVYHRGIRSIDTVLTILEDSSGTQFDPAIVKVFVSLKDQLEDHLAKEE